MIFNLGKKKQKTVLVIDDEPNVRNLISLLLKQMGVEVISMDDPRKAVATALEKTPDLIITDLVMPEMSGFDVCSILKTNPLTKDIPVVLLTGSGKTGDIDKAYSYGVTDYLLKPINFDRFKIKISKILDM